MEINVSMKKVRTQQFESKIRFHPIFWNVPEYFLAKYLFH